MTGLFTPQQRQDIYDMLLEQFKSDERITGVLTLGSPDSAFADDDDGIDLLVIIEKPSIIEIFFTLWVKRLEDLFESVTTFDFIIHEDLYFLSILLDDFIQISIQFRAVNRFNLVGTDWCVAFDRKGLILDYVKKRTMTREQYVHQLYEEHMRAIWNPVVSCVRELRRQNQWKAIAELETLRKHMVEITGLRYLEFTENYRNIHLLPEMFLVQLRHTVPTGINDTAIRRALKITLGMLFAETAVLDAQLNTTYTEQLEQRLTDFVELYS